MSEPTEEPHEKEKLNPPENVSSESSTEQPRDEHGRFLPKKKTEPLYSKREPDTTDKTGTFSQILQDHRDLLLQQLPDGVALPEEFEKEHLRTQIKILKYMSESASIPPTADVHEPAPKPIDKTPQPQRGAEHPAVTTTTLETNVERNRADKFIADLRARSGFRGIRKRMTDK